jgi:hypothetical protein
MASLFLPSVRQAQPKAWPSTFLSAIASLTIRPRIRAGVV